jgi:hypothetical protein
MDSPGRHAVVPGYRSPGGMRNLLDPVCLASDPWVRRDPLPPPGCAVSSPDPPSFEGQVARIIDPSGRPVSHLAGRPLSRPASLLAP